MITEQQVEAACLIAGQVFATQISSNSGVNLLSRDFGLNETSAKIFIDDYKHLMMGRVFKRTLSSYAMNHFIENISFDHGRYGLEHAVTSLREHIKYFEGHYRSKMHSQRMVLAKYEAVLEKLQFK
jgi:5-methylcytosine-specific restriction protein A